MSASVKRQSENYYWQYNENIFKSLSANYFSPHFWQTQNAVTGQEKGRGTTWFIRYKNEDLVLKHYLRGGYISKLNRDVYLFRGWQACRSIAEFEVLNTLHALALPVPEPAAAQVIRKGLCYRADILIRRIPHAHDLLHILHVPQDEQFYQQLGHTIAQFHLHGVFHADLNIQNILRDKDGRFWLIDFDRAKILKPQPGWQARNLRRLKRSFEKEQNRHGIKWQISDWHSLTNAYTRAMQN